MRTIETQTRTVVAQVITQIRCDLCGRVIDLEHEAQRAGQIQHATTVEHRSVVRMQQGAVERVCELDVCGVCFEDKLVPWVAGHGVRRPEYTEEPL